MIELKITGASLLGRKGLWDIAIGTAANTTSQIVEVAPTITTPASTVIEAQGRPFPGFTDGNSR